MDVTEIGALPYFHFARAEIGDASCLIGRLGYSGEAGFEILVNQAEKDWLWDLLSTRFSLADFRRQVLPRSISCASKRVSSCFSRLFDCVIGAGFVTFDEITDVMIDPQEEFYNVKLCPLPLYDPHKTRPRRACQNGPR
jgi:glycine cleavage system aminomethyltransferase T